MKGASAVILLVLALWAHPGAAAEARSGLAVLYPPAWSDPSEEFLNRTASALNLTPEYLLGAIPIVSSGFTRIEPAEPGAPENETRATYNVSFSSRPSGGGTRHWSLLQRVDRHEGELLLVLPEDLHAGLELRGGWFAGDRQSQRYAFVHPLPDMTIGALAPPPGIESNGSTLQERAEEVARRLGLPNATPEDWHVEAMPPAPLDALAILGWHERWQFALDCSACQLALRGWPPDIVGANTAAAYFTAEGAMIAFVTSPWLDLANSTLLPLAEAEATARRALEDRFYRPLELTLEARWLVWGKEPAIRQVWHATLAPRESLMWTSLRLEQDARAGALTREPYDKLLDPDLPPPWPPTHVDPPSPVGEAAPESARATAATGAFASAAAATAAALAFGRRRTR